ncbi:Uncharacterised protein [Vibrio cholerae]|nr:Uncharacterised protein [Vibrio cholerae]
MLRYSSKISCLLNSCSIWIAMKISLTLRITFFSLERKKLRASC